MHTFPHRLRRGLRIPLVPLAVLLALVAAMAAVQSSQAVEAPPELQQNTVETELEVQFGTTTPIARCHNVTVYWQNGMVQRIVVVPCTLPPQEGDMQVDTDHPGWHKLISIPTLFRLRVPHVDAAAIFVAGQWRPLSSFPGGYANIIGGFVAGTNTVSVDGTGRVAYVQTSPTKIVQTRINISADFEVDFLPEAVDDNLVIEQDSVDNPIFVLNNDVNVDGGPMVIEDFSQPQHGVVTEGLNGGVIVGFRYSPVPGYCNTPPGTELDSFTYTLNGGSVGTVHVTVNCDEEEECEGQECECEFEECLPPCRPCEFRPVKSTLLLPDPKSATWTASEWRTPDLSTSNLSHLMISNRSSV